MYCTYLTLATQPAHLIKEIAADANMNMHDCCECLCVCHHPLTLFTHYSSYKLHQLVVRVLCLFTVKPRAALTFTLASSISINPERRGSGVIMPNESSDRHQLFMLCSVAVLL